VKKRHAVCVLCFSDSSVFSLGDNARAVRLPARVKKGRKENGERAARMNFALALRVAGSLYFRPFLSSVFCRHLLNGRGGFGTSGPRH
jgi:hypothetical protein